MDNLMKIFKIKGVGLAAKQNPQPQAIIIQGDRIDDYKMEYQSKDISIIHGLQEFLKHFWKNNNFKAANYERSAR